MDLALNHVNNTSGSEMNDLESPWSVQQLVEHFLNTSKCYDLMQTSSKGTIFETTIPFQLAFFALVEHDTDVATLWDPELRNFVGLVVVQDYITAMRLCLANNLTAQANPGNPANPVIDPIELTSKPISELLYTLPYLFTIHGFQSIDVEENVYQLMMLLLKSSNDYVPIVDPDTNALVSMLGTFDLLHFFNQVAKNNVNYFNVPLHSLPIGSFQNILTTTKQASIFETLEMLHRHKVSSVPVVDELGRILGVYHKSDVSFVMKAPDLQHVLHNLQTFTVENSMSLKESLLASGELISNMHPLVCVKPVDSILTILNVMETNRTSRVVVIDENKVVKGIVSAKDLFRYYIESSGSQRTNNSSMAPSPR